MKKILLFAAALVIGTATLQAQQVEVLNPDPRTAGMGDAMTATSAGAYSIFNNSASALFSNKVMEFGFSYAPNNPAETKGRNLYSFGGYYNINRKHVIGLGGRFLSTKADDIISSAGVENALNYSLDLSYGYRICDKFGLSLTGRYLSDAAGDMFPKKSAISFDLGAYSRFSLDRMMEGGWISAGLKVTNIGFSMGDADYNLPTRAAVGGSLYTPFSDEHTLETSLDLGYSFSPSYARSFGAGLGLEYRFMQLLAVRGGFHVADSKGYSYGTLGLGVRFVHVQLDASFLMAGEKCPWRNTWQLGLGFDF